MDNDQLLIIFQIILFSRRFSAKLCLIKLLDMIMGITDSLLNLNISHEIHIKQ